MTTPDEVKRLEIVLCAMERRHCLGKADGFDVQNARQALHAAIDALAAQAAQPSEQAKAQPPAPSEPPPEV